MKFADWRSHFRHTTYRKGQDTAIDSMAKALDEGQKFVIAELPTGIGKSDAAMALAQASGSAYITTSQNILIDQYERDFPQGDDFRIMKGRTHYPCVASFVNCGKGVPAKCYNSKIKDPKDPDLCTYKKQRALAVASPVTLTNTTYFALGCKNEMVWGDARPVAVVDEAHNLADEVMNLTSMEISEYSLRRMQVANGLPHFDQPEVPLDEFKKYIDRLQSELEWTLDEFTRDKIFATTNSSAIEDIEKLLGQILWFKRSVAKGIEWIVDFELDKRGKSNSKLIARPLDTSYFAQEMFFKHQAVQYVLQSATIVDFKRYAAELGIDQAHTVRRASPFDLSRRPVYDMGIGNMAFKSIDESLPLIAQSVQKILDSRPNRKGLVHTGSYRIQKYLQERFATQTRCYFPGPGEREDMIRNHFSSPQPTVLFSPSMTEGVDGRGDSLRFQIICKIPYPSLADRRVKIKVQERGDWDWYNYLTSKTLIQAIGRGMRSEDDWCDNFILDSGFNRFAKQSKLPADFMASVRSAAEGQKSILTPR